MRKNYIFIIVLISLLASSMIVNDAMRVYAQTDIEDFVDNNSSDIDTSPDIGNHYDFDKEKANDSDFDTLNESLIVTPPIKDFVDNNSSDVDSSSNLGAHSNFTAMQYGPDSIYDNITEVNNAGMVNTTLIDAESFEGAWPPSDPSDWTETGRWNKESDFVPSGGGTYSADIEHSGGYYSESGDLITADLDCSDAAAIYVSFYFREAVSADTEFQLYFWNGATWVNIEDLGQGYSPGWNLWEMEVTDSQYFKSDFKIRWRANAIESGENANVDLVTVKKETPLPDNYALNLEVQFTAVPYSLASETLCIYMGYNGTEAIRVDYWNGTGWENVFTYLNNSSWNNASVSVTNSNFTIRFNGTIESGDTTQDYYLIDCVILRLEGDGHNEFVVQNQDSDVDGTGDAGEIIDFSNMTASDTNMTLLNETIETGGDPNEYSIDLTGGYISCATADIGVAAGTISFWIQFDSTTSGRPVGMNGNEELRLSNSILYADWGESGPSFTSDTTFTIGTWYFVAVTWDETANDLFLYVGTETTTPSLDAGSSAAGSWTGTTSTIPQAAVYWGNGYGFSEPVNGHMDDIRFYDTVRTLSEIRSDYNQTLTGTETDLVNYYKLENDYTDSAAGNDDGTLSGSGAFSTDVPSWEVGSGGTNFILDQEVQWTNIPSNLLNEYLCIKTGTFSGTEKILVDAWNGTDWENLFDDLDANWNNVSIADYLTSSTFTIRFRDDNTTEDSSIHDTWEIDVALIHIWNEDEVYKLDLEVQFEEPLFADEYFEKLCIKTGAFSGIEDLLVDVWDGSQWQEVPDLNPLNPNVWNNASVASYLISSTENFTIRYRGGSETSDDVPDTWQIDAVLLHTYTPFDDAPPNISWGSNQFTNDIGTHQVHIDVDAEDIYFGSGIDTVWYRIWNVSSGIEWVPDHNNVSLSLSSGYEIDINVSTWHPSTEYYVEAFATDNSALKNENTTQNITGDEYRYFTIVHGIDVSQPTVTYSGGSIQELDISVANVSCSYAAHGPLTISNTAPDVHNYTIYTIGELSTGITGFLYPYQEMWQAFDVDISSLPDGDYYVQCDFEDSWGHTGTSPPSISFTKTTDTSNGGGNGGGDGSSDGGGSDGTSTNTFLLNFLNNFYGTKPGQTVTLSGTISSNENGKLLTITFEGETYTAYTFNNGEFEVTLTAPNTYGSYTVTAKFAGDSSWESTSTTCQLLVVEKETQMTIDIDGNLAIGEQITIQTTLTTENGDLMPGEKITIYIYERTNSVSTSTLLTSSGVRVFSVDTRYWDLIATYEITTDENGKATIELTISTDQDVQIVAEYAGKIEGEGGENLGPSIVTYVEGETGPFILMSSEMLYLFGGILATVLVIGLIVVKKTDLLSVIIQREKIEETVILSQDLLDPTRFGIKAVFMIVFDPVIGPMIKESRFFDFQVEFFNDLKDPSKLTLFYSMSATKEQFKLEEKNEHIFVKSATTLIINEADMTVSGETVAPNLIIVIAKKGCNENFVWKFINTVLVGWSDHQGYLVHQMDRLDSENMIDLGILSLF